MKKFSILFVMLFAILATSCNTAFFKTETPSAAGASVFQNTQQTEQVIAGIYELFVEDCSYRNRLAGPWEALSTDIEIYRYGDKEAPSYANHSMTKSGHSDLTKQGSHPWAYLTTAIERANVCISGIEQYSDTTNKEFAYLYGEALTLRAWLHYEMTKLWGDVPYSFAPMDVSDPNAIYPSKVDRNLVYDKIRKDLRVAARMMGNSRDIKWSPAINNVERINREFALGLLARVDLVQAGKAMRPDTWVVGGGANCSVQFNEKDPQKRKELLEECMWACGQVMDADGGLTSSKLLPYEEVFKRICAGVKDYDKTESLWELPFPNAIRGQILNRCGESVNSNAFGLLVGTTAASKSNRKMGIVPNFLFKFEPNDARRWVTINPYQWTYDNEKTKGELYRDENGRPVKIVTHDDSLQWMIPGYYLKKYNETDVYVYTCSYDTASFDVRQDSTILYQTPLNVSNLCLGKYRFNWLGYETVKDDDGVNYHVMRYADILLMFAEASIGSISEVSPTNPTTYDGQACFDAIRARAGLTSKPLTMPNIMDERAFEFCGERIRKYDLMRWGCFAEKLKAAQAEIAYFYNVSDDLIDFTGTPYEGQLAPKWYFKYKKDPSFAKAGTAYVIDEMYGLNLGETGVPDGYVDSKNTGGWLRIDPYLTNKKARLSTAKTSMHIYEESVADVLEYRQYWPLFNRIIDDNHNLWNDYGY